MLKNVSKNQENSLKVHNVSLDKPLFIIYLIEKPANLYFD